jgi:uncharacterized protein YeaO (DUF488 family)
MLKEVAAMLDTLVDPDPGRVVGLYWPFRGERDLHGWRARASERCTRVAVPAVVTMARPFREWRQGCRMGRGVWTIPIPADGKTLRSDVVLAPMVGLTRTAIGSAMAAASSTVTSRPCRRAPARSVSSIRWPRSRRSTRSHTTLDAIVTGSGVVPRTAMVENRVKRAYRAARESDGARILVDRLWPRGMSKDRLRLTDWIKDIAPSEDLRHWFGHDPARWEAFCESYQKELKAKPDAVASLRAHAAAGPVTLVYAAKDEAHNNAVALKRYLEEHCR